MAITRHGVNRTNMGPLMKCGDSNGCPTGPQVTGVVYGFRVGSWQTKTIVSYSTIELVMVLYTLEYTWMGESLTPDDEYPYAPAVVWCAPQYQGLRMPQGFWRNSVCFWPLLPDFFLGRSKVVSSTDDRCCFRR